MAEVFLCGSGQLSNTARRDLRRAGIVVVEVDDPSQCQFIRSSEVVSTNDMVWASLDALNLVGKYDSTGKLQREQLAKNLLTIVAEARTGGAS